MLLAVDTSTQWIGLALYDGVQVTGEVVWKTQSHHTVELAPSLEKMLKRCGVRPADLQALGVALGPGSFTSLRIGLALVKGISLTLHLPAVGVPTLDILAAAQPLRDLPMAVVLSAGRQRLAVGWYAADDGKWKAQSAVQSLRIEEFSRLIRTPTLVCGELSAVERQVLERKRKNVILASPAQSLRRPAYLAEIAWERWQAGETDEAATLSPIYLHMVEAAGV